MGDHAPRRRDDLRREDIRREDIAPAALYPAEPAPDEAAIEAGRVLFAHECRFVLSAAEPKDLPPDHLPEVAFLGRSNVGKSSLVNALTVRNNLARVSHAPGRTRQINFFDLARLMLVDLPGYGFASAPKTEIARWSKLVPLYLKGRAGLKRLLLLVDARHGLKPADGDFMTLMDESAVSFQVVMTKLDKVPAAELADRLAATSEAVAKHRAAHPQLHLTSAHHGFGIAELRAALGALAAPGEAG
jgi:GTP-binding protein